MCVNLARRPIGPTPVPVDRLINGHLVAPDETIEEVVRRGWRIEGEALTRELVFKDFDEAIGFARELGEEAVDWFRRPDMLLRSAHLRLSVENRHHAGFTLAEIRLVNKATEVIDRNRAEGIGQG
jgi:pterin-4a-carbinolamine dehydratase